MLIPSWETKNGTSIPVNQMSREHILNCINLIQQFGWRIEWLERLELELYIRDLKDKK
jgi:hypothetical protein